MKLVRQPKGSKLCGQACVATLADISLDDAVMLCRTKRGTRTKILVHALRCMGVDAGPRWKMGFPVCKTAIMRFTHEDGGSHWVVWHNKKYYDPVAGVSRKPANYLKDSKVTSHIEVRI